MKKTAISISISAFVAGMVLTACNTPAEKVEKAKENVVEASKELQEAKEEYLVEIENYKKETEKKISVNKVVIAEFQKKIAPLQENTKAKYQKRVTDLEHRNEVMAKKMQEYRAEGKKEWENFKKEFEHDMDELGKAIKDLTVDNVK